MCSIIHKIAAFCLFVAATLPIKAEPTWRKTANGFQVLLDQTKNQWSPEIPGFCEFFNTNGSAVIIELDRQYAVARIMDGRLLHAPISCPRFTYKFSDGGNFALFRDTAREQTFIVNIAREICFAVPGVWLDFSDNEDFVIAHHQMDGNFYCTIFDTATGSSTATVPGLVAVINPTAHIALIGKNSTYLTEPLECRDACIVDMKTGALIGQQYQPYMPGRARAFSADGQIIIVQQPGTAKTPPIVALYSAITGQLVETLGGYAEFVMPGFVKSQFPVASEGY